MTDKLKILQDHCKQDLKFLTTQVCGLKRWSDSLHGDLVKHLDAEGDRKLVLLPRGHQKSTIISVIWVIQQLLKNPDETVAIYSATWKLSKQLLSQIKSILTSSALKDIYGSFRAPGRRWTAESIDVAQRNFMLSKNPSITTGGIDTGKTGTHCSLMIFDDIVSPENTTTADQIRKTIDAYKDCLPLLDPGGRIVVIGTRYTMGDLYGQLIEEESRSLNGVAFEAEEQRKKWREVLNGHPRIA